MRLDISKSLVDPLQIAEGIETLSPYHAHLSHVVLSNTYSAPESSINLPNDFDTRKQVEDLYQMTCDSSLRYVFVCGIGGSSLGTKAVYEAVQNSTRTQSPKLLFLETLSKSTIELMEEYVLLASTPEEIIVILISKSGGTTETIVNSELLLQSLGKKFGNNIAQRVVTISDANSPLEVEAKKKGMHTLSIPASVGGRYSVLTSVGLFPLLCAQIDIDGLLSGAMDMRNMCVHGEIAQNIAMQSAIILYTQNRNGKSINTNFIFEPNLESLGKWYRQLMGESIGKRIDNRNNSVHVGITPEVSIGSTDLHSMGQLYMEGPNNKITTFISTEKTTSPRKIPTERMFPTLVSMVSGKSVYDVQEAILSGTKTAYENTQLPFMSVVFDEISTYELGSFLQFKMIEMMYLGKLFNVNPFNQPGVEAYKLETKKLLT